MAATKTAIGYEQNGGAINDLLGPHQTQGEGGFAELNEETTRVRSAFVAAKPVPGRVLLAPWGDVESSNGAFTVDDESVGLIVAAFERHGTDLPIDYEHQTLGGIYAAPDGRAPAAGWIKRIFGEPGVGLLAEIEWTDEAAKLLAAREYRFLSPVAIVRKADRKLVAIHSAALTNEPAIVGMKPIVNRVDHSADDEWPAMQSLRDRLGLADAVCPDDVLLAASDRLAHLEKDQQDRHVEQRLREAMSCGKLVGAQQAWAEALLRRDETLFDDWLGTCPVVVAPGRTVAPKSASGGASREAVVAARARAEYRANLALSGITTEEAFVRDAVRNEEATKRRSHVATKGMGAG